MISIEKIRELRKETSVSLGECKKAIEEATGDLKKASEILRKKGIEFARKKEGRGTKEGAIQEYIHPNKKIGVLLDIRCETDFVARSADFRELSHNVAMQIAAESPKFVTEQDISKEFLNKEKEIYKAQFTNSGKPKEIVNKIIDGKIGKLKKEICLLEQPFIKNPDQTIKELIHTYIAKLGENIIVERFVRYEI